MWFTRCQDSKLVRKFSPIFTAGQFNKLVYNYPIRIPERFSLVIRSLLTQEGICFTLKPDFKFLEVKIDFYIFHVLLPLSLFFCLLIPMQQCQFLFPVTFFFIRLFFLLYVLIPLILLGCLPICGEAPSNRSKSSSS